MKLDTTEKELLLAILQKETVFIESLQEIYMKNFKLLDGQEEQQEMLVKELTELTVKLSIVDSLIEKLALS